MAGYENTEHMGKALISSKPGRISNHSRPSADLQPQRSPTWQPCKQRETSSYRSPFCIQLSLSSVDFWAFPRRSHSASCIGRSQHLSTTRLKTLKKVTTVLLVSMSLKRHKIINHMAFGKIPCLSGLIVIIMVELENIWMRILPRSSKYSTDRRVLDTVRNAFGIHFTNQTILSTRYRSWGELLKTQREKSSALPAWVQQRLRTGSKWPMGNRREARVHGNWTSEKSIFVWPSFRRAGRMPNLLDCEHGIQRISSSSTEVPHKCEDSGQTAHSQWMKSQAMQNRDQEWGEGALA